MSAPILTFETSDWEVTATNTKSSGTFLKYPAKFKLKEVQHAESNPGCCLHS